MSNVYESGQYYQKVKEVRSGFEREYTEEERWKRHGDPYRGPIRQRQYSSQPTTYIARPSYRPIEDEHWQQRSSEQAGQRDLASGSGMANRSSKPQYSPNQASTRPVAYRTVTRTVPTISRDNYQVEPRLLTGPPQVVSGAGDIINTEHGFTIQLDAKHFNPSDIQITLHQHTLSVVGDRLEDDGTGAPRLRRSFTRKYTIPADVRLSSISSYMTDTGYLVIKGSRKGWKETDLTEHLALPTTSNGSVISAV